MGVHPWLTLVLALGWALLPRVASAQAAEMRTAGDQSPDLADVVERLISRTNAFRYQEGRPTFQPITLQITNTSDVAIPFVYRGVSATSYPGSACLSTLSLERRRCLT